MAEDTLQGMLRALDDVGPTALVRKVPKSIYEFAPPMTPFDNAAFFQRLANGYVINDKYSGAQLPFGPLLRRNPVQYKLGAAMLDMLRIGGPQRLMVLKNRKAGVSTYAEILGAELCLQLMHWQSAVIAHTKPAADKLFSVARNAIDKLPMSLSRPVRYNSYDKIEFGTPEKEQRMAGQFGHEAQFYSATAAGEHPLAGHTVRYLHMSECAKYDGVGDVHLQRAFILNALGSIPKTGPSLVIAESTAHGTDGWFYETWKQAKADDAAGVQNDWKTVFICWLDDPACQLEVPTNYQWKRWEADDIEYERMLSREYKATPEQLFFRRYTIQTDMGYDSMLWEQEYPLTWQSAFISSGSPALPRRSINAQTDNVNDGFDRFDVRFADYEAPTVQVSVET